MSRELALCHFSMIEVEPPELVTIAAESGFSHVSLMLQFPAGAGSNFPILGDTPMRRETRRRLQDCGVRLIDASTCRLQPDTDVETFRPMLDSGAVLGARQFNVNGSDPDEERLADRFAALAELGAEYGLVPSIEFMMISEVRTLQAAQALIECSGACTAMITLDALHLQRSGGSPSDLASLPAGRISYAQLCDGPASMPVDSYAWEAGVQRLLPGEGVFPLQALVRGLSRDMVIGIEAPSAARRAAGEPALAYARRMKASLDELLVD
jgi:sugar phosphate isomerase/epimerase